MKKILPTLLATITGKPRYLPEIRWSKKSWVHNVFRAYEKIFWREYSIKAESATYEQTIGKRTIVFHEYYTFESMCAGAETYIRERIAKFKNFDFRFTLPYKLYVPILQTHNGFQTSFGSFPYLFAIAHDATTATTGTASVSSKTQAHTCTGSDLLLWIGAGCSTSTVSTVTYNAASSTKAIDVNLQSSWIGAWYNVAPSTGANNVVVTCAGSNAITIGSMSFTGCSQTGVPDATHADGSQTGSVTSYSQSITTIADNCFTFMAGRANGGVSLTGGTNTTVSQPEVAAMGMFMARSTALTTPAGTATLAMTSGAQQFFAVMASFKPVAVANPVFTKSIFARWAVTRAANY